MVFACFSGVQVSQRWPRSHWLEPIGVNTTIFTLINAVFLNPLPVRDIRSLVMISGLDQNNKILNLNLTPLSWRNFEDYQKQNDVFSRLAGFITTGLTLTGF